jgi:WD40 repeat protein/tRNA A-37 threonylcarbamoyl transferase component Bud32
MIDHPALDSPVAQRARQLDRWCDRFEVAWKTGQRPSLERYLAKVHSAAQPELLRELLILELEYRRQRGEKPEREEYRLRFPAHAEVIDTVFAQDRPSAPSRSSLLRRWTINRLANDLRMLLFSPEEAEARSAEREARSAEGGERDEGQSGSGGSRSSALLFALLARLLGGADGASGLAGASGSGSLSASGSGPLSPTRQQGEGSPPEPDDSHLHVSTQLLSSENLANGLISGMEIPAGMVLGDYELLEPLGKGGMGVVYKARQRSTNRIVALKVIRSDRLEELSREQCQEWFERFRREAQIAASLEHDNLVSIYEMGRAGSRFFYSMRFVDGQSLAEILRPGPLPNARAAFYVEQVARVLHVLHGKGIVHRDLKPKNILIDTHDRPYVTDFGLAKWSAYTPGLTQMDSCMGTPEYMAPEQARDSAAATEASDIYSLGATLYELLTGRPPFRAADPWETRRQLLEDEPVSPRRLNPAVHRDLELICLKCLQKEPHQRYANALEVAEELRRYRAGEPLRHTRAVTKAERVWRWCRRNPFEAGAAGLAMATFAAVTAFVISLAFIGQLNKEKQQTEQARLEVERSSRQLVLERGLNLCEKGEVAQALLLWANCLDTTPEGDPTEHALRANLAAWSRCSWKLEAILPNKSRFAVFSPDGTKAVTVSAMGNSKGDKILLWETGTWKPIGQPLHPGCVVTKVLFSPDGRSILTAGTNGFALLWNVATGERLGGRYCVDRENPAVAFALDGRKLLTATQHQPGCVITSIYDLGTGQCRSVLLACALGSLGEARKPVRLSFSPAGETVATFSVNGRTAQIWDLTTGNPCFRLENPDILALRFSPDGRVVVTRCKKGIAQVWDAETGRKIATLEGHQGELTTVVFSPDGKMVLTGSEDRTARLWEAATGKCMQVFDTRKCSVRAVACSRDGKIIATVSSGMVVHNPNNGKNWIPGTVQLWESATGKELGASLPHADVLSLDLQCNAILTRSKDKTTRVRRLDLERLLATVLPHSFGVFGVAFSPDARIILTTSNEQSPPRRGELRIWDRATEKLLAPPWLYPGWILAAAFSPDSNRVLAGCSDNSAQLFDIPSGHVIPLPHGKHDLEKSVCAAAFSPDGKLALTGGVDGTARLWNAQTGDLLQVLPHPSAVCGVAFSHRGGTVLTGCLDGFARVWDVATGMPLVELAGNSGSVKAVAYSPDDRQVLTGTAGGIAQLWDPVWGTALSPPLHHSNLPVEIVAFISSGNKLLTKSMDRVQLWDAATGQSRGNPLLHDDFISAACSSPDGLSLVSASKDKSARLWDAATGAQIGPPLWHPARVLAATFRPDGRTLLTGCQDTNARLWEIPMPLQGPGKRIQLWVKALTGMELTRSGGVALLTAEQWNDYRRQLEAQGGPPLR